MEIQLRFFLLRLDINAREASLTPLLFAHFRQMTRRESLFLAADYSQDNRSCQGRMTTSKPTEVQSSPGWEVSPSLATTATFTHCGF